MTDQRGGYRKPEKPAPVSGPGRLSKRTDGGPAQKVRPMTGGAYGEGKAMEQLQAAAPMAANDVPQQQQPSGPPPPGGGAPRIPVDVTPFNAPTQNPDEPITAGSPMGAGIGPEALGLQDPMAQADKQDAQRLLQYLPALEFIANRPGSSNAMRAYVRQIKAMNL